MSQASPGRENAHVVWRMTLAQRAVRAYARNPKLAVFAVAGSVGSGLADRFSDLELDCYWHEPPAASDRLEPVTALGARLEALWDFDADEAEWSDNYELAGLDVTVSSFTAGTVEGWLDAVTLRADTDPVKHMRLAAILRCRPLAGEQLAAGWRDRAARYPDELVAAMLHRALHPGALPGWAAREALASRGDEMAVQALLVSVQRGVLGALLAVNRIYTPHRLPKWQHHLLGELRVAPGRLAARLHILGTAADQGRALGEAEALLAETVTLAEETTGIALGEFREALAQRRQASDPPPDGRTCASGPHQRARDSGPG